METTTPAGATREPSLRERTRRAVQGELVDVALRLFLEQGFEATTVDEIAAAAGISRSSFFRYFPGKEELVLSKYERTGEQLAQALGERPGDEPLWVSLRHVLDHVVQYAATPDDAASMLALTRMIAASPALHGAYLARVDRMQHDLAGLARDRARAAGTPWPDDDPAPDALVGAAFACLQAATQVVASTGADLGPALDRAMGAVAPLERAAASARVRSRSSREVTGPGPA